MGRNKKKKPTPTVKTTYKYADMWLYKNAIKFSGLNAGLRALIESIMSQGTEHQAFFNHGDNRDPATNGGQVPGDVKVEIYYQPATAAEVENGETITDSPTLSGRRRLAVRYQDTKDPFARVYSVSFYGTNHPRRVEGVFNPNQNAYGSYTPIDPKK